MRQERRERLEILELAKRTDLVCPLCQSQPTTASARDGKLRPCTKCKVKRVALHRHGIKLGEFGQMMRQQNYCCAVCRARFDYSSKKTSPNYDSSLVCGGCLEGIRAFNRDPNIASNAAKYLASAAKDLDSNVDDREETWPSCSLQATLRTFFK